MGFVSEYCMYLRALNIHKWGAEWARAFLEEIRSSPVGQVSVVLGAMGITGVLLGSLAFLFSHLLVFFSIVLVGLLVVMAITMHCFARLRHISESPQISEECLDSLLFLLLDRGCLTQDQIAQELAVRKDRLAAILEKARCIGWIAEESGAVKIAESMKPIARQKVRTEQTEERKSNAKKRNSR